MASIIRIKRSSTAGNPSTLGAGELAYSALSDNGVNGGDRLYIGIGTETSGNAANHFVIGGKYFTDMMDHNRGTLTANSALLVDADSKLDNLKVDNLDLNGNTISSTDTNGNITLDPNGTGYVEIVGINGVVIPVGTTLQRGPSIQGTIRYNTDTSSFEGYSGTTWGSLGGVKSVDGLTYITAELNPGDSDDTIRAYTNDSLAFQLDANSAQFETKITNVNIAAETAAISTTTGALTVAGGVGIAGALYVAGAISAESASFASINNTPIGNVTPSTGAFTQLDTDNIRIDGNTISSTDINGDINITPNGTGKTVISNLYIGADSITEYIQDITGGQLIAGEGVDVTYDDATGTTTIDAEIATTTNRGVASFDTNNFTVTDGAVTAKNITLGTSTLTLGSTTSSLAGISSLEVLNNTTVGGTLSVTGATTLGSTLAVTGDVTVNTNKFNVVASSGNTTVGGTLSVSSNATVGGTLGVTGATTLSSTLGVTGATTLSSTANVVGDFSVNTNKFTVAADSGNTGVAGTLSVTGATTLSSTLGVTSNATVGGTLGVTGATTLSSTLDVTGVSTFTGAVTANGGVTASGSVTVTAGGTNTSINLVPQGTGTVDVANKRITSVAEPTQSSDAATKNYVDAVKTGLDPKDSVRVATTENLTVTYDNGTSGLSATLTNAGTQAALTIDSIVLSVGNRVLVKDQTSALQNGIYVVTDIGSASTNWVLTRSVDADNNPANELSAGAFTFVEEGTVNEDNGYVCTTNGDITIGTTNITWVQFSGAGQVIAGDGLTKSGNTLNVVGTADRITITADAVDIASTYVGQTSITTLGTIGTGTWQGTVVSPTYGGTGVNNGTKTITLGGNLTTSGAFATTLTVTDTTSVTLPTTGTLATLSNEETLSNKTITSSSFSGSTGAFSGNVTVGGTLGVTGESTLASATVSDLTSGRVTYAGTGGSLQDSANLTFNGTTLTANALAVTNNGTVGGTLGVTGNVTLSANLTGAGAETSTLDGFNIDGGTY